LAGIDCRYDGKNNLNKSILKLVKEGKAVPVCPEQLGGLTTPREPAESVGGRGIDVLDGKARVMTKSGKDVTHNFIKGAEQSLRIAKLVDAKEAILKSKSPSCGCGQVYDGSFTGKLVEGDGVTAALLKKHGLSVLNETRD
jgi:uncharacterized protein YbbK (DUF523 family)